MNKANVGLAQNRIFLFTALYCFSATNHFLLGVLGTQFIAAASRNHAPVVDFYFW